MATASPSPALSLHDKFMFDLNGFLVLRGVFSSDEIAVANAAITLHQDKLRSRSSESLRNAKSGGMFSAAGARMDMGGMLHWQTPHCDLFRNVLAHPRLLPVMHTLLGQGYRLDHQPIIIAQDKDSEGFSLHGGPISGDDGVPSGTFNPELQYRCVNGAPWTSLLAVSVQLCDHRQGDGGFCIVRGSHKLNLPVPDNVAHGLVDGFQEHLYQPVTQAGDVVVWSEATVHGATPWKADHQRRIALYRFSPANMGYGRGYLEIDPARLEGMTDAQRAVLQPPYATRLERPVVGTKGDGGVQVEVRPRSEAKKQFDMELFGTKYF